MDRIKYVAFSLDAGSKARLRNLVSELFQDAYSDVYCDHVTLAYGPEQVAAFDGSLFGKTASLESWNIIYDENGAALDLPRDEFLPFGVNNEHPHVTLACAAGTRPVYSNELIGGFYSGANDAQVVQLERPVRVSGRVQPVYAS